MISFTLCLFEQFDLLCYSFLFWWQGFLGSQHPILSEAAAICYTRRTSLARSTRSPSESTNIEGCFSSHPFKSLLTVWLSSSLDLWTHSQHTAGTGVGIVCVTTIHYSKEWSKATIHLVILYVRHVWALCKLDYMFRVISVSCVLLLICTYWMVSSKKNIRQLIFRKLIVIQWNIPDVRY